MQTLAGNWKFAKLLQDADSSGQLEICKAAAVCRLVGNCTLPNASKMQSMSTADYAYIQRELWPHPLIMGNGPLTRTYA